ncbi:MAG TPA: diaminopimelate epimerase, partial [Clostridiaceae bacterium]|nr:diaminopimelate epimerase [Clostridiaceae bacterium]
MIFSKMQGTGNDFVVIDDRENSYAGREGEIAAKLCDRHFSIGADGILIVRNSQAAQTQMVIINADGSYASMCGNGLRCFVKYVCDQGIVEGDKITVETGDGLKTAEVFKENGKVREVRIDMGSPTFDPV